MRLLGDSRRVYLKPSFYLNLPEGSDDAGRAGL
jgi:hypothetical protein